MATDSPRPDADYAAKVRAALRVRCVHLTTKRSFLGMPGKGDLENPYDTAVWWCERTCEPLGPDGSRAEPAHCEAPGRTCYRPPVRP
jgi:hypothetical protein